MKRNIILICLTFCLSLAAQAKDDANGIQFAHMSWNEAIAKAKAEKKLIFIDFYTQWCGPCLNMAEEVFVLPTVGNFYNSKFVNLKIDAENGEGKELAKKYQVRSYPTYLFIDATTQEAVHFSSSRQSPEQFINTGKSALNPTTRSPYLNAQFEKGNKDRKFLISYIEYMNTIYKRDAVSNAFKILMENGGSLEQADIWNLFVDNIGGSNNPYFAQVVKEYNKFVALYGKIAVDSKLEKETAYMPIAELDQLCDFEGKKLNREFIILNELVNKKDYDNAIIKIDELIADQTINKQKVIDRLKFIVRRGINPGSPANWAKKCLEYTQYIAYNNEERRDPYIHQEYAAALESYIRLMQSKSELPESVLTKPSVGKDNYNMRPDKLKSKPVKKH